MTNPRNGPQPRAAARGALGVLVGVVALGAPLPRAAAIEQLLSVKGRIEGEQDVSAVEVLGGRLVIGSDEGAAIQILDPFPADPIYRARRPIRLLEAGAEWDIEGIARQRDALFVLGSHSVRRRLVKPGRTVSENRARLDSVVPEPARQHLFRITLDPESDEPGAIESISLHPLLARDPLLAPFTGIPDKENGLSLEALAVADGRLWIGCRSPVLREGYVPVLVLPFAAPQTYERRFVRLDGRGIRGLATVGEGFLLLAVAEREQSAVLYLWDGEDQIPGANRQPRPLVELARLESVGGGVPEGIAVVAETAQSYEILLAHDGAPRGGLVRRRILRPGQSSR